jgi:hypothetical protein
MALPNAPEGAAAAGERSAAGGVRSQPRAQAPPSDAETLHVTGGRWIGCVAVCAASGAALAVPVPAFSHSSLTQAGAAGAPVANASAVIGGAPWPGRRIARITYFNASSAKWSVEQAVKAWNSSGARVRFVAVARRRAQVLISDSRGPRSDTAVSGFASIGYTYPGGGYVHLSRLAHPRRPHYTMAGVATHELGHVLGLDHEDRRCATMNTSLWAGCGGARPCRLLERDDIQGAIKLYGGRARMTRPAFCPKPPSGVQATGDANAYGVTLEWENPRGPFFDRVQVARGKGSCPARPQQGTGWQHPGKPGAPGRFVDRDFVSGTRLLTGRYCYALWALGDPNVVSKRRTLWVEFNPPRPAAPADLRAVLGEAGGVTVTWEPPPHPELEGVEGSAARGLCPTQPSEGEYFFGGEGSGSSVQLETSGRYCFVVWTRDSAGALIGPTTGWLDYAGSPPEARFDHYSTSLTTSFYDQSTDSDGDEIVARRWDFGDGSVVDGNEPNPVHTYGAARTYNVQLTVTDASGLTAATTVPVTVSE